ncbi:hypothetical protein ABMA28_000102 [Loxostege sticticalis]|uniref:PQ-loop repeat-containing protein 3 n=1 Tax=Loxostege sticticalis TaxID=481309 RepID=A0ABD0TR14_LOXSC
MNNFTMEEHSIKAISTLMSAMTITSCLFLKIPQIMSIMERRSADGIYVQAMVMEVTGFSIMTLYNFTNSYSIMTYMEYPIILIQVYILFYYVLMYKRLLHLPIVRIATIAYIGLVAGFMLGLLPKIILAYLVPLCTPLSGFAKVTYVYGIVKSSNADAVSLTTWIISVLTNLSRIFTVYVDSGDGKLMFNFLVSSVLSAGVLFTAIYYQSFVPRPPPPGRPRRKPSYHRHSESMHYD